MAVSPTWSGKLEGAAVEGVLAESPQTIHAGAAVALSIQVDAGSETLRREQVAPLNPNMHSTVRSFKVGDRVRLIGLKVRPDWILVPTTRTVIARVDDLPDVVLPTDAN